MKFAKIITILAMLALMFAAIGPAYAQLGQTDISSFTVQNVDDVDATVEVIFVDETGASITPATLNDGKPNPFTLKPGDSFEIYVPGIPETELPNGRYSVTISSSAQVVAIANLIGQGDVYYNGSYSGFSEGASTFYLPAVVYNYYGWYSLISVQNVGSSEDTVTVNITCEDGTTGSLSASVPSMAAHHFELKNTSESEIGFPAGKSCNGSAVVSSTGGAPLVAVDNQTVPGAGNTQSYGGFLTGANTLYAPALYHGYYNWDASINILKSGAGATKVTVTYSDGGSSTCDLTDAKPNCLLYMPTVHSATGYFGATITSNPATDLLAVVNAANGSQAQTYNAISGGSGAVGIPSVMKSYYGWNTSFTCQNVGDVATALNIEYQDHAADAYTSASLAPGESLEVYTPGESFLANGYQGGATVTAASTGAQISCIVNFNNGNMMSTTKGDWSMSYNAFNQ